MPDRRRRNCRACGERDTVCGSISWTGLCNRCAKRNVGSNIEQMVARDGPNFSTWRRAMAASVGGVLLDEPASSGDTPA